MLTLNLNLLYTVVNILVLFLLFYVNTKVSSAVAAHLPST